MILIQIKLFFVQDGEPITPAWSRFGIKSISRTLKIRPVHVEDSGLYECKGVNGFGSQIARIRVLVVGKYRVTTNNLSSKPSFLLFLPSFVQN